MKTRIIESIVRKSFAVACLSAAAVLSVSAAAQVGFGSSGLSGESSNNPTTLMFGPDDRLYVGQKNGTVFAYNVERAGENDYDVVDSETIDLVKTGVPNYDDDGTPNGANDRQVTGLFVAGSFSNPVLYVSSSDPRIGAGGGGNDLGLDTNSGVITKLTCSGGMDASNQCLQWDKIDLIRGLPRSEENHATNGMQLDENTNSLYIAQGGHANAGAPSNNFAFTTEYALSAALLVADLNVIEGLPTKTDAAGVEYKYNLPTVSNVSQAELLGTDNDHPDPFGGDDGLNQAMLDPNGPVQIFASGFRNLFDVVQTQSGRIYGVDNGANGGWGGLPEYEESYDCTNNYLSGEPGSNSDGPDPATYPGSVTLHDGLNGTVASNGQPDAKVNNKNGLHLISQGYYGGHPAPIRGNPSGAGVYYNGTFYAPGNPNLPANWPPVPPSSANPVECDFQNSGVDDAALANFGPSTNGITEYTASNFGGALQGVLLAAGFSGSIYQIELNAAGDTATNCPGNPATNCNDSLFSGFGSQPLDVTALGDNDLFPGTVWAVTYGADNITIFEPDDFSGSNPNNCTGADDPLLDEDEDGFDNADEIDNGSNPCSGGSKPVDRDGDLTSDLNDPDDDNDGLADNVDHFVLDADNGTATSLPVIRELFSDVSAPVSFFGMGFSGLMANGNDYLTLIDDIDTGNDNARQLIAGGTAGLFTDTEIGEGDAVNAVNTQANSFQFGIDVDSASAPFTIKARILGDFLGAAGNFASQGIYIGSGDQDNYIKLVVNDGSNGAGGFQFASETGGTFSDVSSINVAGVLTETYIDLYLSVDPANGDVTAAYELESNPGTIVTVSTTSASGDVLAAMQGSYTVGGSASALAVGTIATSSGPAPTFIGTWDFIYITEDSAASLDVTPTAIDFGAVTIGATSSAQSIDLTHTGGALSGSVTVSNVSITGADAAQFSTSFSAPVVLAPGDTQTVALTFTPSAAVSGVTATVEIAHDGANASPQFVSLTGDGVETPALQLCINAGGPEYVSTGLGLTFVADSADYFDNGTVYTNAVAIAATDDDTVFHTERYATNLAYSIPVPGPGDYSVELYFAELYFGAPGGGAGGGIGSRVFDIVAEGATVLANYDIFDEVGALTAVSKTYSVTVNDAQLNLDFPASVNNGKVNAICVSGGAGGNQSPTVAPIANQTSTEGDDISNAGLAVVATDPEDSLAYSATGLPPGVSIEPTNGQIFGVVATGAAANSPYAVTVSVDDANNPPVTTSFTWTVSEVGAIAISMSSPIDGATIANNDPTLTWSTTGLPNDNGDHVHLYVDTDNFTQRISPLPLSGSVPLSFYTGRLLTDGAHSIIVRPAGTGHVEYAGVEARVDFTVAAGSVIGYRVNAGGPALAAGDGSAPAWAEDTGAAGSATISPYLVDGSNYGISTHNIPIDLTDLSVAGGPAVEALFQKERWDNPTAPEMQWAFPVTTGATVEVRLYLAETYDPTQVPEARVFDVAVEGTVPPVFDDIDPFSIAGADKAFMLAHQLTMNDDTLNLEFLHGTENPAIKGIEIIELQTGVVTAPSAFIQVLPGAGLGASTFGAGSLQIANNGDTNITSVTFDLSSSVLPDVVFDPVGTAGDNAAKCLVPAAGVVETAYVTPTDNCVDPFFLPHNGVDSDEGYDGISVVFTDFNPGETFTFAVDIDPTSIREDVTAGDAGSVSGLEMTGALVTVTFDNGAVLSTTLFEEGSLGGANAVAAQLAPASPLIAMTGITSPGLVTDPNQTIDISGPANAVVSLLQLDAHLYIDAGQPNPGYDIDPFEANSVVAKPPLYLVTLDGAGQGSVPVTLLQTPVAGAGPDGGINHFIAVVEGVGDQNSQTSNVLVIEYDTSGGVNAPPVVTDPGSQSSVEGDAVSLQIVALGPEGDQTLSYSATGLPPELTIDPATGLISGTIADGSGTGGSGAFVEQGGIVVIEMESADNRPANWVLGPDENPTSPNINNPGGAAGGQFLVWEGGQSLGNPGNGLMTYPVQINTPGTYQFQWRNQVGNGTNTTEHNDTWLKIEGDSFYGQQGGSSIVCPKGYNPALNDCTGDQPEGSGSGGWFKVYSSGANNWSWVSNTSDNDAHQIYARFDTAGVYNVLVSARSSSHVIDRMVLAKTDYSGNPQSLALSESARDIGGGPGASADSPYSVDVVVTDNGIPVEQATVSFVWNVTDGTTSTADMNGTFGIALRSGAGGGGLALPVAMNVYATGTSTLVYGFTPTADAAGSFSVAGMAPGTYDITLKYANTLQVMQTVTLAAGNTNVDFGELPVGDVNDDNTVNILDLSSVVPTFDKSVGDAGYDGRADLNGDGQVNILDLSGIVPNFDTTGAGP